MRRLGFVVTIVLLATACSGRTGGGGGGSNPTAVLQSITVSPPTATTIPGATVAFTATAHYDDGSAGDVTASATWTASPTSVATVASGAGAGVATAIANGTATVKAAIGAVWGSAQLTVEPSTTASLSMTLPPSMEVSVGTRLPARAYARSGDAAINVTNLAVWTSAAPAVGTVSDAIATRGSFEAKAVGTTRITAMYQGQTATSDVQVVDPGDVVCVLVDPVPAPLPVGATVALRATAVRTTGSILDVTADATWMSDSAAVSVAPGGAATTAAPGIALVRATYGGLSGTTGFAVVGAAPTSLEVTPSSLSIPLAGRYQGYPSFAVTIRYADQTAYDATPTADLLVANPAVATLTTGLNLMPTVRGVAPGTTAIEVRYAGVVASVPVTVQPGTAFSIDAPSQVPAGAQWQARALVTSNGYVNDAADLVSWTSSAPGVLAVSDAAGSKGRVTALAAGTATLTATGGGASATRAIQVVAPVQSIAIDPTPLRIPRYATPQLTATATLADGGTLDVTKIATWFGDSRVLYPSTPPGVFYALHTGSTMIVALVGGVVGSTTATVLPRSPAGIAVRPALSYTDMLPVGHTAQLRAVWQYDSGTGGFVETPIDGPVTWTSDAPAIADFDDPTHPGRLHAMAGGYVRVRAQATTPFGNQVEGMLSLTCVDWSTIALAPIATGVGGTAPFALQILSASGYALGTATPFATYASSDLTVLAVRDAAGYGMKAGTAQVTAQLDADVFTAGATVSASTPARVVVTAPGYPLVGATFAPTAKLYMSSGDAFDVTALATWSSSNMAVLSLAGSPPVATALTTGGASIRADAAGITGNTSTSIGAGPAPQLDFRPRFLELAVGGTATLSVVTTAPGAATPNDVTSLAVLQSSAPDVIALDGGTVRALRAGSATVTATYRGMTAVTVVRAPRAPSVFSAMPADRIVPVHVRERVAFPAPYTFAAGAYFSTSQTAALSWTSSDPTVAEVVAPGQVEARAPGLTFVTAASPRWQESYPVRVADAGIAELRLFGWAPVLPAGVAYPFDVQATYADGYAASIPWAATWSSADPAIADFDAQRPGLLVAKTVGTVRVTATVDGVVAAADVVVS